MMIEIIGQRAQSAEWFHQYSIPSTCFPDDNTVSASIELLRFLTNVVCLLLKRTAFVLLLVLLLLLSSPFFVCVCVVWWSGVDSPF